MLPKKKRLTTAEFNRFFSSGKRVHGTYVQLIYSPYSVFHGAAVVGKKVFKKAVLRNKLRRRMYAVLYGLHRTTLGSGVFILIAKPPAAKAGYKAVAEEIRTLVKKIT